MKIADSVFQRVCAPCGIARTSMYGSSHYLLFIAQVTMPKYYCDYCDTFLTHDSPSVRKTHNGGRKHKENVRMFYQVGVI
ncbi:unnamed protein product [Heligmosomoides polygyrus]|uniref:Matrin-type domain-containing protein n=1 Tax=Heligmosomoides polygyrus TaxID=6339 RepID=A0A183FCP6_HELPZ|nr:unnamed protein product [Heligmosomoides polygyrus]